jgi:hypothetical protein
MFTEARWTPERIAITRPSQYSKGKKRSPPFEREREGKSEGLSLSLSLALSFLFRPVFFNKKTMQKKTLSFQ